MSSKLLKYVDEYLAGKVPANEFDLNFVLKWKDEGHRGLLALDDPLLNEVLCNIFSLCELFNKDEDREEYEIDEIELHSRVLEQRRTIVS